MNNARRKELERALELIAQACEIVQHEQGEEQDYFDNMPEGIQASEKGDLAQEVLDALDEADQSFDALADALELAQQ